MSITIQGQTYVLVDEGTASEILDAREDPRVIEVIVPGAQGAQGPPGVSGAGYDFVQASAASTWTINHNLGFRPLIQTRTAGGINMLGEVQHLSVNVTQITFTEPTAGTARLT